METYGGRVPRPPCLVPPRGFGGGRSPPADLNLNLPCLHGKTQTFLPPEGGGRGGQAVDGGRPVSPLGYTGLSDRSLDLSQGGLGDIIPHVEIFSERTFHEVHLAGFLDPHRFGGSRLPVAVHPGNHQALGCSVKRHRGSGRGLGFRGGVAQLHPKNAYAPDRGGMRL